MPQYLYFLSNPSMPGLIKVGKTTTSPNRRMADLHSTGVPTPFVLEVGIEVADCHVAERDAHTAIGYARVAENREFFRIGIEETLQKILPRLGTYKVVEARSKSRLWHRIN
jgi:hypothetical protein